MHFSTLRRRALAIGAAALICPTMASAQDTSANQAPAPSPQGGEQPASGAPAAVELPAVDVVQSTPAKKAASAKKKAVAVSPLSSAPPPASTAQTAPASEPVAVNGTEFEGGPSNVTVPSAVTTVTDTDIQREGTGQVQQVLQQQVPGIIISDAAGNPMRAEVSYRGFDASPVSGRSQGVAVYQNGIRINEAFGDTVNWDVLPSNAIASMSIVSNNPSFGLNALGGAVSVLMKDGFSYEGAEIDVMGGSFGRRQIGIQAGGSSGNAGIYVAAEGIQDDGFRDNSESEVKRFYGDIGLKGSLAEVHFSLTAAQNEFGATAAAPIELLDRDWSNTFTSPQTTNLEVFMPTLSGSVKATDTLTFSGAAYYRRLKSRVVDGNVTELEECQDPANAGFLCLEEDGTEERVTAPDGSFIPDSLIDDPLGSIERLNTDSRSWGGAIEAQEKSPLFGRPNQFLVGLSYDHGRSKYRTSSELGTIQPGYVVDGSGIIVAGPEDLAPRDLETENTYWGLYFSNALDVTDALTFTFGGRFNHATIKMEDQTGLFDDLNTTNKYSRFNPMVGANYKLFPGLSIYGGYSESNRAPTPAELGCAEPDNPCLIESFLTDDPPLNQVVGRTAEIGLRGERSTYSDRFTWGAGLFRTLASDDILPVTDPSGRVYFLNAGNTLRQGIELNANYQTNRWQVYASYALVDASLDKCSAPDSFGECAFLREGSNLPGIPRHRFKAGFQYWLTPKWKVGADLVAASDQPFFPNEVSREEGLSDSLAGYTRVDLNTSYDITENVQIYGLVKNLFNKKYGLYGTYFEAEEVSEVDEDLGGPGFDDSRTISPSMPFAAYGGVRVRF